MSAAFVQSAAAVGTNVNSVTTPPFGPPTVTGNLLHVDLVYYVNAGAITTVQDRVGTNFTSNGAESASIDFCITTSQRIENIIGRSSENVTVTLSAPGYPGVVLT